MTQNILIYSILGFFGLLFGFLIFQIFKLKKRLDIFLSGENKGLEQNLKNLLEKTEKNNIDIKEIFQRISKLEKISKISFQKIGFIRYNSFKNVGGDQSFSIALLDNQNSGFVITSMYMKQENRMFAKSIKYGKAEHSLSEEEKQAVEKARQNINQ
ncbi:MAG: DUF4446 family protein [Candidatus Pacebacteria bacterium]|nr:DUF4446 family protein [Candidatus Paceibacterota bacterium]